MIGFIVRVVAFSQRRARAVARAAFVLALVAGLYTARHIQIDSDTEKLVDPNLPWQKAAAELDQAFPQNDNLLVAVVDGQTGEQAADAAAVLTARLAAQPRLFRFVRQPKADPYFKREGLLLLPVKDVQDFADHIIAAQPFLGMLGADPSVRGVLGAIDLLAVGALRGEVPPDRIDSTLQALADCTEAAARGRSEPLSWQSLFLGQKPDPGDRRQFVVARAALDFGAVTSASECIAAVRAAADAAGLTPASGVTVRVTGPVALNDDQLSALSEGAGVSTALCLGLLLLWLALGLRSVRAVAALLLTLLAGLLACATFAVACIGPFNPVSIAFAPLFIGIAIDFGIQFGVRYSAERREHPPMEAGRRTAVGIGAPLTVAAFATAAGFLAFAPTSYLGVRDLGLIAGLGMIVALALNVTLLPALLVLFGAGGRSETAGFTWGADADRLLARRRSWVLGVAGAGAAVAIALLPRLGLDFNPVDLQNPHLESVRTLLDLVADPNTSPYTAEFLVRPDQAEAVTRKLGTVPEVGRVLDLGVFLPTEQEAKLAILQDAAALLGPTLTPPTVKPPPSAAEVLTAVRQCAADMRQLGAKGDAAARRLAEALDSVTVRGAAAVAELSANLAGGVGNRLEDLRTVLSAGPVTLATLPEEFRRDWQAPDGRWRVQVFPSGDTRSNQVLRRFARAVLAVVPAASGSAVDVESWTELAPRTFATAGALALVVICILILAVLREARDAALVLVPLLLAILYTLGAASALGLSINFANIIALPMILGLGVAFDIYIVMRLRARESGLLSSPTARAVIFSAMTTGTAFGSLTLSQSPGMAGMGQILSLALGFILICTLIVLPALPAPRR